jgi:hypothetical protein
MMQQRQMHREPEAIRPLLAPCWRPAVHRWLEAGWTPACCRARFAGSRGDDAGTIMTDLQRTAVPRLSASRWEFLRRCSWLPASAAQQARRRCSAAVSILATDPGRRASRHVSRVVRYVWFSDTTLRGDDCLAPCRHASSRAHAPSSVITHPPLHRADTPLARGTQREWLRACATSHTHPTFPKRPPGLGAARAWRVRACRGRSRLRAARAAWRRSSCCAQRCSPPHVAPLQPWAARRCVFPTCQARACRAVPQTRRIAAGRAEPPRHGQLRRVAAGSAVGCMAPRSTLHPSQPMRAH